jgi:hypothetical protein
VRIRTTSDSKWSQLKREEQKFHHPHKTLKLISPVTTWFSRKPVSEQGKTKTSENSSNNDPK